MNNIHVTVVSTVTFSVCQPSQFLDDALGKKLAIYFAKQMGSCKKHECLYHELALNTVLVMVVVKIKIKKKNLHCSNKFSGFSN